MRAVASIPLLLAALAVRVALGAGYALAHAAARGEPPTGRGTWAAWVADRTLFTVLLVALVVEGAGHVALVVWARRRLRRGTGARSGATTLPPTGENGTHDGRRAA